MGMLLIQLLAEILVFLHFGIQAIGHSFQLLGKDGQSALVLR